MSTLRWHLLRRHPHFATSRPPSHPRLHRAFSSSRPPLAAPKLLDRLRARYPDLPASALPSLAISFLILHEITAVVPLIGVFYALRAVGAGEGVVAWVEEVADDPRTEADGKDGGGQVAGLGDRVRRSVRGGLQDAQQKAEKVARHYGWFGYEKKGKAAPSYAAEEAVIPLGSASQQYEPPKAKDLRGDIANLVGSYLLVKALMPARIALSLYYAPAFSRLFIGRAGGALKRMGEKVLARRGGSTSAGPGR